MDDVQIPQVASTNGPDWHFFGRPDGRNNIQNDSYYQQPYQGASLRQQLIELDAFTKLSELF